MSPHVSFTTRCQNARHGAQTSSRGLGRQRPHGLATNLRLWLQYFKAGAYSWALLLVAYLAGTVTCRNCSCSVWISVALDGCEGICDCKTGRFRCLLTGMHVSVSVHLLPGDGFNSWLKLSQLGSAAMCDENPSVPTWLSADVGCGSSVGLDTEGDMRWLAKY